ncbi:MAG: isoprenylcysteine carboxylmethyltransferase family protein [Eubacterium sp.]|nr:isoprenylcysteine carboxylmethyltransferase family protein [Eubacterium sp.]
MLFQIAAIIILVLFYGCYLYKMFMQKKSGIQTDQMGKGKTGFTKWIEVIMKAATYLTVAMEVVSIILNTGNFPVWARAVGLILAAVGVLFFTVAVYTMKDSWRAGVSHTDKTAFVTSGIFQISRNPAFLGFDLVYIGIVCMFFNVPLLVISIAACLMLHLQIVNNEEPFLQEVFGAEYLAYQKRVNRYLGKH